MLILGETTAALDNESEQFILDSPKSLIEKREYSQ